MSPSTNNTLTFTADAVLFDMDGTLTDSIAAVEAAWGKVAKDIGQDPAYVIAATHGKRAIDNLAQFKPELKAHEMDDAVTDFENTILYYADAFNSAPATEYSTPSWSLKSSTTSSIDGTPYLTPESSAPSSTEDLSDVSDISDAPRRPSFITRLSKALMSTMRTAPRVHDDEEALVGGAVQLMEDTLEAWRVEAMSVDRSVRILPGVRKMIDSLPEGRYAVATSGAKTYAYGCMTRVGITPPAVTITADDKRLKAGKPAPDPFLLAADCLGFDAKKCVVFEDSPSGIRAGVASGATVIAVCTSHERAQIENCGAHFLVENMEDVVCETVEVDGMMSLKFTVRC
ncbi:HAD-like protein [Auriscalpium vulgare]|uniref:HAD-like protein n=1 Tax=Auriscalpium vulgare TaxID=40419 RepID=A0ACB8RE32_9AGAM|nr:HAD-like protein [Auriscalpium vulgare]